MPVPAAVVERYKARPSFDKPSRNAKVFNHSRGTVALELLVALSIASDNSRVLFGQVERFRQLGSRQDAQGLLRINVDALHHAPTIRVAAKLVNRLHELVAILQPFQSNSF